MPFGLPALDWPPFDEGSSLLFRPKKACVADCVSRCASLVCEESGVPDRALDELPRALTISAIDDAIRPLPAIKAMKTQAVQ